MTDRALRLATAVLALAGAGVTGYLVWVRETGATIVCATGGCGTVQSSEYAEVAGVPVALLGLVGYLVLFSAALFAGDTARLAQAAVALGAVIFSTYLFYVQVALIGDVCDWCLVSDVIVTLIAMLALLRLRLAQAPPASSITSRHATNSRSPSRTPTSKVTSCSRRSRPAPTWCRATRSTCIGCWRSAR